MAGTSWDKLGQMDAAFEIVGPAIRRVAGTDGARLHEFFRDDPVWRLDFSRKMPGDPAVDVSWNEDNPAEYAVSALWWEGDSLTREEVGVFTRDRSLDDLERLLREAISRIPAGG